MNKITVDLDEFEDRKVVFTFGQNYSPFMVHYGDNLIGQLDGGVTALRSGTQFATPDGNTIYVELKSSDSTPFLEVLFNGVPVPSSPNYPAKKIKAASRWVIAFGLLFTIFGSVTLVNEPARQEHWSGYLVLGVGIVLLICSFGIRKYYQFALWTPLLIVGFNFLLYVAMGNRNIVVLLLNGLAIYSMIRAIKPMHRMKLVKMRIANKSRDDLLDDFG